MSAWEFAQLVDEGTPLPDMGAIVASFEVIEIDDGIRPYFFYYSGSGYTTILFDRDVAQKNKLEQDAADNPQSGSEGE